MEPLILKKNRICNMNCNHKVQNQLQAGDFQNLVGSKAGCSLISPTQTLHCSYDILQETVLRRPASRGSCKCDEKRRFRRLFPYLRLFRRQLLVSHNVEDRYRTSEKFKYFSSDLQQMDEATQDMCLCCRGGNGPKSLCYVRPDFRY